jgi:hypothetical protein
MHRLVFADKKGLFAFQGAIMGWGVVDGYMARRVQVIFVIEGGKKVQEEASLQFWRPIWMNGETMTGDAPSKEWALQKPARWLSISVALTFGHSVSSSRGTLPIKQGLPLSLERTATCRSPVVWPRTANHPVAIDSFCSITLPPIGQWQSMTCQGA